MKAHVKKTFDGGVLTGLGGFGSIYKPNLEGMPEPVLVAGTDGVGTKLAISILMDKHDTVGQDLVAMCVNDVLCQGARPMFFLDYIATGKLEAEKVAELVKGVADGCLLSGCALVGGETAEMPGFYRDGDYDMAGFAVGIADAAKIIDGSKISVGDKIIGLASSGVHSNGFSLVRKVFFDKAGLSVDSHVEGLDGTLGETLLTPTKIYVKSVASLLDKGLIPNGIVHITGGGFYENIPRILPEGTAANIDKNSWAPPPIFGAIARHGNVAEEDMFSTFNMGIGLMLFVKDRELSQYMDALREIGEDAFVIGEVCGAKDGRDVIL
jgi:phosphoribosylformylglycinamidine cyclo-ligase